LAATRLLHLKNAQKVVHAFDSRGHLGKQQPGAGVSEAEDKCGGNATSANSKASSTSGWEMLVKMQCKDLNLPPILSTRAASRRN
jgi:hypothetical protein